MRQATPPAPPFLVQCYRRGQFVVWVTDCTKMDLDDAIEAAEKLHADFDRCVRVIDQEEQIHFRLGKSEKHRGRR